MSELPIITELGANLDRAVRASMSARRPLRRRWFMLSAATVLIVGSAAVATQLFTSDDEVAATTNILCEQVDSVISPGALSPVEACTAEATREGVTVSTNDLVACQPPRMAVTVVLGGPAECERRGWRSLGAGYATIRGNVTKLTAAVTALEKTCMPLDEFTLKLQHLLDTTGWSKWTATPRPDLGDGICSTLTAEGGDGTRSIEGAFSSEDHRVFVFPEPPRAASKRLTNLMVDWMDRSGELCFSAAELRATVGAAVRRQGFAVSGLTSRPLEANSGFGDRRGERYTAGCAVVLGLMLSGDGTTVAIELAQRTP